MPMPFNYLVSGLDIVDGLFDQHYVENGISIEDYVKTVDEHFRTEFLNKNDFAKIPSVNIKSSKRLQSKGLVRFRCMIQDMKDVEFFSPVVKVENKNKPGFRMQNMLFRDSIDCATDSDLLSWPSQESYSERHVYSCTPIPCETSWVKRYWFTAEEGLSLPSSDSVSSFGVHKRERPADDDTGSPDEKMKELSLDGGSSKRMRTNERPDVIDYSSTNGSVVVKVYFNGESLKLNDMVEFFGIWTPQEVDDSQEDEQNNSACDTFVLHALHFRKLVHTHPKLFDQICSENLLKSYVSDVLDVRQKLHNFLTAQLLGDELAASYLICNLISFVTHKNAMPLGKFALNLFNVPSTGFASNLFESLNQFVTKILYLPLSLSQLNSEKYIPKKDYGNNSLISGRLQLTNGTLLVVDETKLETGQLVEQGVRNMTALQSVITNQRLDYDFQFHGVEFKTDLNVLLLSEGKSCLQVDFALPLKIGFMPAKYSFEGAEHENLMESFRDYLALVRFPEFIISDEMQTKIREDFVLMRRESSEVTQLKLHELLVLARWMTFSFGTASLTPEIWDTVRNMEVTRQQLLNSK